MTPEAPNTSGNPTAPESRPTANPARGGALVGSDERHDDDRRDDERFDTGGDIDRLRRWRLILGGGEADGVFCTGDGCCASCGGEGAGATEAYLSADDQARDAVLAQLYDGERRAGLGSSAPRVARWLGDIRTYFPNRVVQVMQQDAMDRLGLRQMLAEPEMLESVQPDVNLVSTLIGLGRAIPPASKESARKVVRVVVEELEKRLASRTRQAVTGALSRSDRTRRPRLHDIDWLGTIAANLAHYQPDLGTVIPERLVGYGRRTQEVRREIVLCIDQSGSMAPSIVYSSVFGAVLASMRSVATRLVVFDTSVVDLTDQIDDPVDVLFGVQLGGGTDIGGALGYCQSKITRPADTIVVLISDLYEGGVRDELVQRCASMVQSGATVIALLALSDEGAPAFDAENAAALGEVGVPAFACTPDLFPDLMAAAIERRDLTAWASDHDIPTHG